MKGVRLIMVDKEAENIYAVGREHEHGRIERLFALDRTEFNQTLGRRLVMAFNACEKLSDASLQGLSESTTTSGSLAERIVAWSLFMYNARPTALKILSRAREKIFKDGGQV